MRRLANWLVLATAAAGLGALLLPAPLDRYAGWVMIPVSAAAVIAQVLERRPGISGSLALGALAAGLIPFALAAALVPGGPARLLIGSLALLYIAVSAPLLLWRRREHR